jgi:hypothetical protein
MKNNEIKMPFPCQILDKENIKVVNPFSGESVMLTPQAVAVYDTLRGAEITENYVILRKGLDWFRKHYPTEYMVLLD